MDNNYEFSEKSIEQLRTDCLNDMSGWINYCKTYGIKDNNEKKMVFDNLNKSFEIFQKTYEKSGIDNNMSTL